MSSHTLRCGAAAFCVTVAIAFDTHAKGVDRTRQISLCGAVALATASHLVDRPISLAATIDHLPRGDGPWSMDELRRAADRIGLPARVVEWRRESVRSMPTPAIVCLGPAGDSKRSHFVVVAASGAGYWQILDSPRSARWVATRDLLDSWNGMALHVGAAESDLPRLSSRRERILLAVLGLAASLAALGICATGNARGALLIRQFRPNACGIALATVSFVGLAVVFTVNLNHHKAARAVDPPFALLRAETATIEKNITTSELMALHGVVELRYRIHNAGRAPAIIHAGVTSCQCARASIDRAIIEPGDAAEMTVAVKVGEESMRQFSAYVEIERGLPRRLTLAGTVTIAPNHPAATAAFANRDASR